jgi:hypothetical protein
MVFYMIEVRDQFRKIAKSLLAQAEVAGGSGHSGTTGRVRELIVQKFLRPHLPKELEIRSGVIIDSTGKRSSQQDCVILDTRMPLVDIGSDAEALLIAESVLATIEVKSFLNKQELIKSLEASASTKKLIRKGEQVYRKGSVEIQVPEPYPILTYILAYDGFDLATAVKHIADFATEHKDGGLIPEAICILQKGVIFRSPLMPIVEGHHVTLPSASGELKLNGQPYRQDALLAFYQRLIDDVMPARMRIFDIDCYYSESDLE